MRRLIWMVVGVLGWVRRAGLWHLIAVPAVWRFRRTFGFSPPATARQRRGVGSRVARTMREAAGEVARMEAQLVAQHKLWQDMFDACHRDREVSILDSLRAREDVSDRIESYNFYLNGWRERLARYRCVASSRWLPYPPLFQVRI